MMTLTTPDQISRFQLVTLRGAVKLEKAGLRHSSGKRASVTAKALLGLPKGAKLDQVLEALDAKLAAA